MQTSDCTSGCADNIYDHSTSTAYSATTTPLSVTYGDGSSASGIKATDYVCLGSSDEYCTTNFPFFNVKVSSLNS